MYKYDADHKILGLTLLHVSNTCYNNNKMQMLLTMFLSSSHMEESYCIVSGVSKTLFCVHVLIVIITLWFAQSS
jgi:hypothetical protein